MERRDIDKSSPKMIRGVRVQAHLEKLVADFMKVLASPPPSDLDLDWFLLL